MNLLRSPARRACAGAAPGGGAGGKVRPDQWEGLVIREAADRYGYVGDGWVNAAGYQSVGVPGTVAGLDELLRRFGTIAWEQAVTPAVKYARDGFQVTGNIRSFWVTDYGPDVYRNHPRIQGPPESKRTYTRAGELYGLCPLYPSPSHRDPKPPRMPPLA